MVEVIVTDLFKHAIKHIKNNSLKERINKHIENIINNPEIGKFLKYRKFERKIYIPPYRLIYFYNKEENKIYLLDFDKRDKIYRK